MDARPKLDFHLEVQVQPQLERVLAVVLFGRLLVLLVPLPRLRPRALRPLAAAGQLLVLLLVGPGRALLARTSLGRLPVWLAPADVLGRRGLGLILVVVIVVVGPILAQLGVFVAVAVVSCGIFKIAAGLVI